MTGAQIMISIAIITLLGYSAYAASKGKVTISQQLRDWSLNWTCLPFCMGFLMGHWAFPNLMIASFGWMIALPIILSLLAWDIVVNVKGLPTRVWFRYPGMWLLIGEAAGLLWSQTP